MPLKLKKLPLNQKSPTNAKKKKKKFLIKPPRYLNSLMTETHFVFEKLFLV